MSRWWLSVALTAVWLAQGATTQAQYLPSPPSAGLPPEPAPVCLTDALPGPLSPQMAPQGPPDCLGIPAFVKGAFSNQCPESDEQGVFVSLGSQAMQRQHLGHGPVYYLESQNLDTGIVFQNPRTTNFQGDYNDLTPDMAFGAKGTIGYLWGNHSVELTGFFIPQNDATQTYTNAGRLSAFFTHPPVGFEGDNGLWLQADGIRIGLETELANAELNYRYWNKAITEAELILGVRYTRLQERLSFFTDDDFLTVRDSLGNPDPFRQATYMIRTHNNIVAPQIGFEWQGSVCSWLSGGMSAKGAWGVNYFDMDVTLVRGDNLIGKDEHVQRTYFSHMYELGFFFDLHLLERVKVRTGYNLFWILNVPEAVDQIDYDLSHPAHVRDEHGSVFYHGPSIELQFLF